MKIALQTLDQDIFIFTDSLSTLQALSSNNVSTTTNRYILEIKDKFIKRKSLSSTFHVYFFWIPSHIGIEGNEYVDKLAKNAASRLMADYQTVPYTDLFESLQKKKHQTIQKKQY